MAMTAAERTAVRFLVAVAVVGSATQAVAQWRHRERADPAAEQALRQQIAAVDSARRAQGEVRGAGSRAVRGGRRAGGAKVERVRSAAPLPAAGESASHGAGGTAGFTMWPPSMTGASAGGGGASGGGGSRRVAREAPPTAPIDVDRASAGELEALPRVGPGLARRIVEDREAHGAFGSLEGLGRVRGVGPALIRVLAPHVTFSGAARRGGGR